MNQFLGLLLRTFTFGVIIMPNIECDSYANNNVRIAAVAGTFYPREADILHKDIVSYMTNSTALPDSPQLLISPHAGYVFSGAVAGKGYATINKHTKRVIILGPSHYQYFEGIALTNAEYYQSPLGKVKIDVELIARIKKNPLVVTVPEAEKPEHSIEVQLPFLQVQLENFIVLPILFGHANPEDVSKLLLPLIDEHTLVVASSDLSHYHEQNQARVTDDRTIATILNRLPNGFIDGCGEAPIRVIMSLAEKMGLKPLKLDARTSYETAPQYCSKSKVVGYVSIVYLKKSIVEKQLTIEEPQFPDTLKKYLLTLARECLNASVNNLPIPSPQKIEGIASENRGCFVTLTMNGSLRGCIGYIDPIMPLYKAVIENARNAAIMDPRFSPVTKKEIPSITIEISALTIPKELTYKDPDDLIRKLKPQIDGVILQKGYCQSTFLPQVWEQLPDKIQFLEHLSMKAGLSRDDWKTANYKVYTVEHFEE